MAASFYALNQENFAGRTPHFLNQGNWCLYGAAVQIDEFWKKNRVGYLPV